MCQFSSIEIERCRLKSIQWARRIAGRGASFNCLHDFGGDGWSMGRFGANPYTAIRKANRTAGRCSCGGELDARRDGRAYAFCPVCRDRQRRQSVKRHASAVSTGSCSWPGCDASAAAAGGAAKRTSWRTGRRVRPARGGPARGCRSATRRVRRVRSSFLSTAVSGALGTSSCTLAGAPGGGRRVRWPEELRHERRHRGLWAGGAGGPGGRGRPAHEAVRELRPVEVYEAEAGFVSRLRAQARPGRSRRRPISPMNTGLFSALHKGHYGLVP